MNTYSSIETTPSRGCTTSPIAHVSICIPNVSSFEPTPHRDIRTLRKRYKLRGFTWDARLACVPYFGLPCRSGSEFARGLWVTTLAEVTSSLGAIAHYARDVYPSPAIDRPSAAHLRIAETVSAKYRGVMLIACVFQKFSRESIRFYGIDPRRYFSASGLSFDAMLKHTKIELEVSRDEEKVLFIQRGVRGGVSQSINRFSQANNKYMWDFDNTQESKYNMYFDVNNLYG